MKTAMILVFVYFGIKTLLNHAVNRCLLSHKSFYPIITIEMVNIIIYLSQFSNHSQPNLIQQIEI